MATTTQSVRQLTRFFISDIRGGVILALLGTLSFPASYLCASSNALPASAQMFSVIFTVLLAIALTIAGLEVIFDAVSQARRRTVTRTHQFPEGPELVPTHGPTASEAPVSDETREGPGAGTCPKCGVEYFSSAPLCFACTEDASSNAPSFPGLGKTLGIAALGLVLLAAGVIIENMMISDDTGDALSLPRGVVVGAVLASAGIGAVVYAVLARDVPLWRIREGARSTSRAAAASVGMGMTLLTFMGVNEIVSHMMDVEWMQASSLGYILLFSFAGIVAGCLRRPRMLFRQDVDGGPDAMIRFVGATILILVGALVFVVGIIVMDEIGGVAVLFVAVAGMTLALGGVLAASGPLSRPWVPNSYMTQYGRED